AYTDVDLQNLSTKTIFEAAKQGDILARKVIHQAAKYLGMAMSSLVNILNPEAIIFSGGLSKEKELLVEPASKIIMQRAISEAAQSLKIETTELGREGPVLGAAALFLESMRQIS
ncbi:MAG: ROK family protein, partial [Synergistetes bacterium]|nr:ROK family protein [Synergistota bacterium]